MAVVGGIYFYVAGLTKGRPPLISPPAEQGGEYNERSPSGSGEGMKGEAVLDIPSPALGQAVANAVHQAVTDPYFVPLERLTDYLTEDSSHDMIPIDMISKWTLDDRFPTCFTWDCEDGKLQVDKGASAWVLEEVVSRAREGLYMDNPRGLLYINTFIVEGEKYWLGFLKVPLQSEDPSQMAGVFFSMDRYLAEYAPRIIDKLVTRRRFPLVQFQCDVKPIHKEPDGDICIRILDVKGGVYLQRGRTFDADKMIYAESDWYPKPIVCMMEGWDLQVFSANAASSEEKAQSGRWLLVVFIVTAVLMTLFYWVGVGWRSKQLDRGQ